MSGAGIIKLAGHRREARRLAERLLEKLLTADLTRKGSPDPAAEARKMIVNAQAGLPTWFKNLGAAAEANGDTGDDVFTRAARVMACLRAKLDELGIADLFDTEKEFAAALFGILSAPDGEKVHQKAVADICGLLRQLVAGEGDWPENATCILGALDEEVNSTLAKLRYAEITAETALTDILLRAGILLATFHIPLPRNGPRDIAARLDVALWNILSPYQDPEA